MIGLGMDTSDAVGEFIEQGQQTTTNIAQNVVSDVKGSVSDQLGFKQNKNINGQLNTQGQANGQQPQQAQELTQNTQMSDEERQRTKDMVTDFYSPTSDMPTDISTQQDELQTKKKLLELRKKLHDEVYYEPLINPKKAQEERPAERVEKQEMQELQDLHDKQDKKPPPLGVQHAQKIEKNPGVDG